MPSAAAETLDTIHVVQLYLDPRRLVELGKMNHLPLHSTDTNYLVHCALGELFGDAAPKPFAVDDDPRTMQETARRGPRALRVLGYTAHDADTLIEEAKLCANVTVSAACDFDRLVSKEMPSAVREGRRLGFEVRACPVIRRSSAGSATLSDGSTREWSAGEELDAFLARAWDEPDTDLDREPVYVDWLRRQFEIRGGAEIESAGVERFSIERMTRRTQDENRKAVTIKRPDVTLRGVLTVTDPDPFQKILASGLGRHKSFGYGMLKIRRA